MNENEEELCEVIIPAAGLATRLRPLSTSISKAMVRVNGKPAIDYILSEILKYSSNLNAKIEHIIIVDGEFNDIRKYLEKNRSKWPFRITLKKQRELRGPLDAIYEGYTCRENKNAPVAVWLGDAIILEEDNLPLGTDFLLTQRVHDHFRWCMWDTDNNEFTDKPEKNLLSKNAVGLVGVYSFADGKQFSDAMEKTYGCYDISALLKEYSSRNRKFSSLETDAWYDIGELQTYHRTCGKLLKLKSRAFNEIEYNSELNTITKRTNSSDFISTLQHEMIWYKSISNEQSMFVPRIFETGFNFITMTYESGQLLSDIFLHEDLPASTWQYIIERLISIKLKYFNTSIPPTDIFDSCKKEMWYQKSLDRLDQVSQYSLEEKKKLIDIANGIVYNRTVKPILGMHGDFHLGNILYNYYNDSFKFLDPRGKYGSVQGTFGDSLYDWAKLSHDLYHGYTYLYQSGTTPAPEFMKSIFIAELEKHGLNAKLINDAGLLLLATCVPLHYEDTSRQNRFISYVKQELLNYDECC